MVVKSKSWINNGVKSKAWINNGGEVKVLDK